MSSRISLDPKRDFLAADRGTNHSSIAESPAIQSSLEAAFAHFCLKLHAESPLSKSEAFCKIEGARQFIDTWLNFGWLPEPEKPDSKALKPLPKY